MRDEGRREEKEKEKEKKEPVSCLLSPHYNPYIIIHVSTLLSVYIHTQQHRTYCVQMCNTHTHTHTRNGAEKRSRGRSGTERNGGGTEEERRRSGTRAFLNICPNVPGLRFIASLAIASNSVNAPTMVRNTSVGKREKGMRRRGDEETRG